MAPFKSVAQRKKFGEMVSEGKMTKEEFDKWAKDTPQDHKLPERVNKVHPPSGLQRLIKKVKTK